MNVILKKRIFPLIYGGRKLLGKIVINNKEVIWGGIILLILFIFASIMFAHEGGVFG